MTKKKIEFRGNQDNIVVLTVDQLDDLIFSASYRAANMVNRAHYKGLLKDFSRINSDMELVIDEIEQMRVALQTAGDRKDD